MLRKAQQRFFNKLSNQKRMLLCLLLSGSFSSSAQQVTILAGNVANVRQDTTGQVQLAHLTSGQWLRFQQADGKICTLRGPYQGKVQCPSLFSALWGLKPRNYAQERKNHPLWTLDVQRGGYFCFRQHKPLHLWRVLAEQSAQLVIQTHGPFFGDLRLSYSVGEHSVLWQSDKLPWIDGQTYILSLAGETAQVTLFEIPDTLSLASEIATWMTQHQCLTQVEVLFADDHAKQLLR